MPIKLTDDNVEEYVAFFTEHVHGEGGPFLAIEEDRPQADTFPANLTVTTCDPREGEGLKAKVGRVLEEEQIKPEHRYIERHLKFEIGWPLTTIHKDERGRWVILGTVLYSDHIFRAAFAVTRDGMVEMLEDQPLNDPVFAQIRLAWPKGPGGDGGQTGG